MHYDLINSTSLPTDDWSASEQGTFKIDFDKIGFGVSVGTLCLLVCCALYRKCRPSNQHQPARPDITSKHLPNTNEEDQLLTHTTSSVNIICHTGPIDIPNEVIKGSLPTTPVSTEPGQREKSDLKEDSDSKIEELFEHHDTPGQKTHANEIRTLTRRLTNCENEGHIPNDATKIKTKIYTTKHSNNNTNQASKIRMFQHNNSNNNAPNANNGKTLIRRNTF